MAHKENIYFAIYELFTGQDIGYHYSRFMENQWLSESDIYELQVQKLREILQDAACHVPYYRRMFRKLGINPERCKNLDFLKEVPLLRKEDIQREHGQLISEHANKKELKLCRTGGSTGKNINFYLDRLKQATIIAARLRSNTWIGLESPFVPTAHLWVLDQEMPMLKKVWHWMKTRASHSIWLDLWKMDRNNVHEYVAAINAFRPKVLVGYSTALFMLAMLMEEKHLHISFALKVISTAELLSERMKQEIHNKISSTLFDRYGCREVGLIAMTCEHGYYHINADNLIVEVLDQSGAPAKPGQEGEVVITDLNNRSMPFIRYAIEDRAIKAKHQCSCGRGLPCLEKVTGRTGEIVVGVNGDYIHLSRLAMLMEEIPEVEGYQIHQKCDKSLHLMIKMMPDKRWRESFERQIRESICLAMGGKIPIFFSIVDEIPLPASGKFRYVISDFDLLNENVMVMRAHKS